MDEALQPVLAEYERRAVEERQLLETLPPAEIASRIDEFLIPIGPDTGKLLHLVITAARARVLVELGASYGYSTLWLADAARVTGGRVHSLELSAKKVDHARPAPARGARCLRRVPRGRRARDPAPPARPA